MPARVNTLTEVRRLLKEDQVEMCPLEPVDQGTHPDPDFCLPNLVREKRRRWDSRVASRSTFRQCDWRYLKVASQCAKPPLHYNSLNWDRASFQTSWHPGKYHAVRQNMVGVGELKETQKETRRISDQDDPWQSVDHSATCRVMWKNIKEVRIDRNYGKKKEEPENYPHIET